MIKLLVVDDSALMRKQMRRIFEAEADFALETCKNGAEALVMLEQFRPDVIALDINMPEMDGLTALSHIMVRRPTPVVMVSSLTTKGAMATLEALALGAVDFVTKPGGTISLSIDEMRQEVVAKIRAAVGVRLRNRSRVIAQLHQERKPPPPQLATTRDGVVLIGISTGGPRTLEDVLPQLPENFPWPVVVAQHMPASFTGPFANRMGQLCALPVVEVVNPTPLQGGTIYIGHGGADLVFVRRLRNISLMSKPESLRYLWHPSVDLMVDSALEYFPAPNVIGVLMTGMGYDGAASMARLHETGGRTIAEAEETCAVFGMPAELIARNGATVVLPSHVVAGKLVQWVRGINARDQKMEV
jgi:two-component system chemotaxis response regulator CheB